MANESRRGDLFFGRPNLFRFAYLIIAIPMMVVAVSHLYRLVNGGTPENYYKATESRLYIKADITSARIVDAPLTYFSFRKPEKPWIRVGDLVTAINDEPVVSLSGLRDTLQTLQEQDVTVKIQRPSSHEHFLKFRVRAEELSAVIRETPVTVYVWHVSKGGASYRAGMRPGDLIYEINGKTFIDREEADEMVARTLSGQTITFGVIRNGVSFDLKVTMARLIIPVSLLFYQIVALLWLTFSTLIAMARARLKAARILAFAMLFLGVSQMVHQARQDWVYPAPPVLGNLTFFLGIVLLIHLSYYFPRENVKMLRRRIFRAIAYLLLPFSLVFSFLFEEVGLALGLCILVIPQIFIRYRYDRRRSRERILMDAHLLNGFSFCFVSFILWCIFRERMTYTWDVIVRGITGAVLLAAYGVTITRFRLLGIEIKRSLQYVIMMGLFTLFLLISYLNIVSLLAHTEINLLNVSMTLRDIEIYENASSPILQLRRHKMTLMVLSFLVGLVHLRVGFWGRHHLRRKFHRNVYDYLTVSDELKRVMDASLDLETLVERVAIHLGHLMMLKNCVVLAFNNERVCALGVLGIKDPEGLRLFCKANDQKLAHAIKPFTAELSVDFLVGELKEGFNSHQLRYLCPIQSRDVLLGCILTGEKLSEAAYVPRDFRFLGAAAGQAAVAMENAILYEKLSVQDRLRHELELARNIQMASLPQKDPVVPGLDISGISLPALEVGGDYYAYFINGKDFTVILGDVSGKGTSAALYMSKLQGIFASLNEALSSPRELFIKANKVLYREIHKQAFITAIGVRFSTEKRSFELARAGHLPLLYYSAKDDEVTAICPPGLGLGINNTGVLERVLESHTGTYQPGDIFLFISDGLSEISNANRDLFGERRIMELLECNASMPAHEIRDAILEAVAQFADEGTLQDDQTIVVVKVLNKTEQS